MATTGNCFGFEHYDLSLFEPIGFMHPLSEKVSAFRNLLFKSDLSNEHCVEPTTEESTLCTEIGANSNRLLIIAE